jgi:hypothetical protein
MITETIYLDHDNVNSLELQANGTAQDISACTRMTLKVADKLIDSGMISGVFDWVTNGADGQLDMTLGHQELRVGLQRATLTIWDTTYTKGLVWGDFVVDVKKQ